MITLKTFVFNPFQENTYILSDESREAVLVDAGFGSAKEFDQLLQYIEKHQLKIVRLINTHGHIDHVLGLNKATAYFGLEPEIHPEEIELLQYIEQQGAMFGMMVEKIPVINRFLKENELVKFGNSSLRVIHVPGHSKGSVAFFSESDRLLITGDVLFKGSIGRTDLPTGDYDVLMKSIESLIKLGDDVTIFPGHGPASTIGMELKTNPFLNAI